MGRGQKKMREIWTGSLFTQQIWSALHIDAQCIVAPIYILAQEYLTFIFCKFFYLSISSPSAISVYPYLSLSPLAISIFLTISIYLYRTKQIIQKGEAQWTIHCVLPINREIAYLFCFTWWKRKYIELKTTEKLNFKRTSIATVSY